MVDYLSRRLRRLVKEEIKRRIALERGLNLVPGLIQVVSEERAKIRWLFGCIIVVCNVLFLVQVVNSISQYVASPIKSDVNFAGLSAITLPSITLCSSETPEFAKVVGKVNSEQFNKIVFILKQRLNLSVDEIWRLTDTFPNILAAHIIQNNEPQPESISYYPDVTPFGNCVRFQIVMPPNVMNSDDVALFVQFLYQPGCAPYIMGTVQSKYQLVDIKGTFAVSAGASVSALFSMKQFRFINRHQSPCMSENDRNECERACRLKKMKELLQCRFPFIPSDVSVKVCDVANMIPANATKSYEDNVNALWIAPNMKECECYKYCDHNLYRLGTVISKVTNSSEISLNISKTVFQIIQERYKYDMISFLSDIGGNMGLFLGLSIPTIAEIAYFVLKYKKQHEISQSRKADPIYLKIIHMMHLNSSAYTFHLKRISDSNHRIHWHNYVRMKHLVSACCIIFYIIFLFMRTTRFVSSRKSYIVDAVTDLFVEFPTILLCNTNTNCEFLKIKANEKLNKTNYCDVDFYDLISFNNATELWKKCSNMQQMMQYDFNQKKKDIFGIDPFGVLNVDRYQGINGPCSRFNIGRRQYYGLSTLFVTGGKFTGKCSDPMQKIYFVNQRKREAFWDYEYWYPVGKMLSFKILETKKLKRLSTRNSPCINEQKSEECRERCLKETLQKKLNCWLPFMPTMKSMRMCNTSIEAIQAKDIFEEAYLIATEKTKCGCVSSCQEYIRFLDTWDNVSPLSSFFLITLEISGSEVEEYTEIWNDNVTKFLSDVGGTLGMMLGVSLIMLVTIVLNFIRRFI